VGSDSHRVTKLHGSISLAKQAEAGESVVQSVPILSIKPGYSPRLHGEDSTHIRRLAEIETKLPPILVDHRTMTVIDGMHRLRAASLNGQHTIEVEFFEGTPEEAFLRAVEQNVTHGFPLAQADRRAAAARIIASHPNMSDRAIAELSGLGTRAVATIRRATETGPATTARIGRDGKVRPLNSAAGRRKAAEVISERPEAPLREVARCAGVSPATVRDVRMRLARGEDPVPNPPRGAAGSQASKECSEEGAGEGSEEGANLSHPHQGDADRASSVTVQRSPSRILERLLQDPSLRHSERGRRLLRLLQSGVVGEEEMFRIMAVIPPHCSALIRQLARHNSEVWLSVARELDKRARITDPWERDGPVHRLPGMHLP
jgi:ParB-like nuclease domain